ncbi:hypothetical protein F0U62_22475 [Cystobacter fuscus]|uniref:hypothetical protein n=1 Tax=Cystobacter fuscus TaxID=43 RepID=UPI002B280B75|nr:hypothetical protein F0U62_22475 [Cystobacter fuscus]
MFSDNEGGRPPERMWDARPPTGQPGYLVGEATFSATPPTWTPAWFARRAWSLREGHPVERPPVVACRYTSVCR